MTVAFQGFSDGSASPPVRGFLHRPEQGTGDGLVLAHGAGSSSSSSLLTALSGAFAGAGFTVLRCDLPFRQARPYGPPRPGDAERDRDGLRNAVAALRKLGCGRMFLGGHSYGGRQATMLCAAEPDLVAGLLLLSYPLHPPRKPAQLRVQHLPGLAGAGVVCAWHARSLWVDRGNGSGGEDDSGKDRIIDRGWGGARSGIQGESGAGRGGGGNCGGVSGFVGKMSS